jgi:hypothetical protein
MNSFVIAAMLYNSGVSPTDMHYACAIHSLVLLHHQVHLSLFPSIALFEMPDAFQEWKVP